MRAAGWGLCVLALFIASACGDGATTPTPTPSGIPTSTPLPAATSTVAPPAPTDTPSPGAGLEPRGFPIDPATRLGLVVGESPDRHVEWGAGPNALSYTRDWQTTDDTAMANNSGWDCRTHVEYEGQPAVDFYVPQGTPVRATMDGVATLAIVTVTNAFDYYGVARGPYMGDPDRSRAPVVPFDGPGGGKGVFVRVENEGFVTEYGHLEPSQTIAGVPPDAFIEGYGATTDYESLFAPVRHFTVFTDIARWNVKRGDVVGFVDDTGYSDAPHLHYTIRRGGETSLLCPTTEAGFADGGWLMK